MLDARSKRFALFTRFMRILCFQRSLSNRIFQRSFRSSRPETIVLAMDEVEALRLADVQKSCDAR